MANDQLVVSAKRLSTDLRDLKSSLRRSCSSPSQQVTSAKLKKAASTLAETWLADISQRPEMSACISAKSLSDLNVHFQRILVYSEKATIRRRYDEEINTVLKDYTANVVVPLMQGSGQPSPNIVPDRNVDAEGFRATAFVGHSFADNDLPFVRTVVSTLEAIGIKVVTGEKPRAEKISDKVKKLIDAQYMFVGIFTRRDRLVRKKEWSTSAWVIDEKAYASRTKKLILLKESGVESIGGIQGDHQYIEFSREKFGEAVLSLVQFFDIEVNGLR